MNMLEFECTNFAGASLSFYQALRLVKSNLSKLVSTTRTFLMCCGSALEESTVIID